ncbi:unnamed protein product [Rhizophagus irregularis]|nr:unnamed protein product [Rhizophagus irregularis]
MEYADSGTLRNYLKEHFNSLDWSNKLNIALQLASAVSYLHDKGIVHHNLHSNNVLVHQGIAKLTDFGLSKRSEESSNIQSKLFDMIAYGLREKPVVNTPEDYIKIYTDCWNDEPNNRPIINENK